MKKLRSIHLYLGCIFAPLLLFFAVSAIWQTLGFHTDFLTRLATIHTSHQLKNGSSLPGCLLKIFVLIMALSFVITTILGVTMGIKHSGSQRAVFSCLAFAVAFPIALVLVRALEMRI
jgi:hypothetical protein